MLFSFQVFSYLDACGFCWDLWGLAGLGLLCQVLLEGLLEHVLLGGLLGLELLLVQVIHHFLIL